MRGSPFFFLEGAMNNQQPNGPQEGSEAGVPRPSGNGNETSSPQGSQSYANESSGSAATVEGGPLLVRKATGPRTVEGKQSSSRNALKHGIFSDVALLKGELRPKYDSLLNGLREALQPVGKLEELLLEKLATTAWRYRRLIQAEVAEIRKGIDFMRWDQQTRDGNEVNEIGNEISAALGDVSLLILRIANPFVLERCLDLLAELREQFKEIGFTESDNEILSQIYGNAYVTNLGDNLYKEYKLWLATAEAPEDERIAEGYASPEECKSNVLEAIDKEIRRLKQHRKAQAAIETQRLEVEAVRRVVPESPALDRLLRYEASLERSFDRTLSQLERLQRMRTGQIVPPELKVRVSG
jgi:hypothetical protein